MTEPIARVELLRAYRRVVEARDIATPPSRLAELAADPWRPTRIAVAVHPWAPPRAIDALLGDTDSNVVWRAVQHPAAGGEALTQVAADEADRAAAAGRSDVFLRAYVVHHPNTPATVRDALLRDGACGCGCPGSWCAPAEWQRCVRMTGVGAVWLWRRGRPRYGDAPSRP
jgi:hypothetical protein